MGARMPTLRPLTRGRNTNKSQSTQKGTCPKSAALHSQFAGLLKYSHLSQKPAAREQRGELEASRLDGDNEDTMSMVINEEIG
jgi:hypothetical protein